METKLIAAEIATAAGVTTIITSSRNPASLFTILEYHGMASGQSSGGTGAAPAPEIRPPHTLFVPSATPLRDLKAWTRHTLTPAGAVVIDSGAHSVLSRRESGGRLLAAGVLSVREAFASGQAVRVLVRKGAAGADSGDVEAAREAYVRGLAPTRPGTPRATAVSPRKGAESDETDGPLPDHGDSVDSVVVAEKDEGEWEVEEVGRGLANYNSVQIDKVKGLNRCVCPVLCGSCFPFLTVMVVSTAPTLSGCLVTQIPNMLLKILAYHNLVCSGQIYDVMKSAPS
jgi:glutamate 5-kinase